MKFVCFIFYMLFFVAGLAIWQVDTEVPQTIAGALCLYVSFKLLERTT